MPVPASVVGEIQSHHLNAILQGTPSWSKQMVVIYMPVAGRPGESRGVTVSAEDEERVRNRRFSVFVNQHQNDRQSVKGNVDGQLVILAHYLLGKPPKGMVADHINNDPLNNDRSNLRHATFAQNAQNRTITPNKSGYLGVSEKGQKWQARCNNEYLGTFDTAEEAARHYDSYVVEKYGQHAKRNFPNEHFQPYVSASKRKRKEELPLGVHRLRQKERFMAYIGNQHLGTFDTSEEAACAYTDALLKKLPTHPER